MNEIRDFCKGISLVQSFENGSPYEVWNNHDIKYGAVTSTLQSATETDGLNNYTLRIYYADRLLKDESNRDAVWDDAMNVLRSVYTHLREDLDDVSVNSTTLNFNLFVQEFADYLGGAYVDIEVSMVSELGCSLSEEEEYNRTLNITTNGVYDCFKYDHINVEVPTDLKLRAERLFNGVTDSDLYCANMDFINTKYLPNVTSLRLLCLGCRAEIIDLSDWNVSAVTKMTQTFQDCPNLKTLYLRNWDLSAVTSSPLNNIFGRDTALTDIYMEGCNEKTIAYITTACNAAGINPTIHQ